MRITREMLLKPEHSEGATEAQVRLAEKTAEECMGPPNGQFTVWEFYQAPWQLLEICGWNGGDEDWLVVTRTEPDYLPRWLECMDSGEDPDVYILKGIVVYVGSHS